MGCAPVYPGIKSQLCHFLLGLRGIHVTTLSLRFLTCKMGMIITPYLMVRAKLDDARESAKAITVCQALCLGLGAQRQK